MTDEIQGLKAWLPSIKLGFFAFIVFLLACFVYGWLNDFTFWHAQADAGLNSAIAHAIYYGVFAGPVIWAAVTFAHKLLIKK